MPRREKAEQTDLNETAAVSQTVRIANPAARAASADAGAMLKARKASTAPLSRRARGAGGLSPQTAPSEPDPDELKAQAVMGSVDRDLAEIHRRIDRVLAQWDHG